MFEDINYDIKHLNFIFKYYGFNNIILSSKSLIEYNVNRYILCKNKYRNIQ